MRNPREDALATLLTALQQGESDERLQQLFLLNHGGRESAKLLFEQPGPWAGRVQGISEHGRSATLDQYLRYCNTGRQHGTSLLPVLYTPTRTDGRGRKQAPHGCQRLKRIERLHLYAATHDEYDIRSCHASILHENCPVSLQQRWPTLKNPGLHRAWVQQTFRLTDDMAKVAVQRLVSMTDTAFMEWAQAHSRGPWTGEALPFCQDYSRLKQDFLTLSGQRGGVPSDATPANALYFALEDVEAAVVWEWVRLLLERNYRPSMAVLGDAIMLSKDISEHEVLHAFAQAAATMGYQGLQLQKKDLASEFRGHVSASTKWQRCSLLREQSARQPGYKRQPLTADQERTGPGEHLLVDPGRPHKRNHTGARTGNSFRARTNIFG
jgi:hypothetical protein